ncbi:MAG: hypothetical protein NWE98_02075 [Candidatus Bathyarchaeota archaeon]|nr:hypothetical protein [Candidatus Bathyarchaeota archaeon]
MADYANPSNVKENCGVTYPELGFENENAFETAISRLITRASRLIDRYCGVPDNFFNGGAQITQINDGSTEDSEFTYDGSLRQLKKSFDNRVYILDFTPVIQISGVYENTALTGSPVWVEITNYSFNPVTGRIVFSNQDFPASGVDNVKFVYTAGYETLPSEIELACEELVQNALMKMNKNQLNAKIRFGAAQPIETQPTLQINSEIKEALNPYKRRNF